MICPAKPQALAIQFLHRILRLIVSSIVKIMMQTHKWKSKMAFLQRFMIISTSLNNNNKLPNSGLMSQTLIEYSEMTTQAIAQEKRELITKCKV
jgi:hypothetical protein